MKRIMAVYDEDPFYADRFAEFVNQKEAAFHAVAFTSLARLRAFSEQQRIEMLLVGDSPGRNGISGKGGENCLQISGYRQCIKGSHVLLSGKGAAGADGSRRTEKQDNRRLFPCWKMRKNGICIYVGAGSGPKQQGAFSDVGRVLRTVCPYGNGI